MDPLDLLSVLTRRGGQVLLVIVALWLLIAPKATTAFLRRELQVAAVARQHELETLLRPAIHQLNHVRSARR